MKIPRLTKPNRYDKIKTYLYKKSKICRLKALLHGTICVVTNDLYDMICMTFIWF